MLFVERSNRTETLFAGLAQRLTAPGRDPLARSVVVVQGAGMERWIAQRVARLHGVCANVEFPFPRPFLESVFAAIPSSAGEGAARVWDLDRITWAIAKEIDAGREETDYAPLARHLGGADGDWRLVQLARQIANVFDQYITYRPDWIEKWERGAELPAELAKGSDVRWQIRLFQALRAELGPGHMAERTRTFLSAAASPARAELTANLRRRFPAAIEIFAVSTLPPLHLAVVRGLATLLDVRLSVLAPSRAWYSDLWRELRHADPMPGPASPIAALLAGLGRLGADFQKSLEDASTPDGGDHELFVEPTSGRDDASLLLRLQARLLDLVESESEAESEADGRSVARADDSIRVHLCHGPRRELEVVEGVLRAAFERDPSLAPEDVIVMAPDIDAIASDIDAVFGPGADERGAIPYRIADRGTYRRSPVADGFRALLALVGTRMPRSAVFDWLALSEVGARFGIAEAGVEALADWAEQAGIRFGLDEEQREALGLPRLRAHTLAGGLDRLVLAHALGATKDVVRGLAPVPLDAFADPALIGAIAEVDALLQLAVRGIRQSRSVADWTGWLAILLARCVVRSDANSHEHAAILTVLERLRAAAAAVRFERKIPFEAIRERLVSALEDSASPQAFLAGGVTFCQLVPLRAIPFRVVVITGLVDGEFPRGRAAAGFDLMARHPRAGDRTIRADDRHLFLEALLSAREKLVLTVPARDLRNGQARPPSIVVSELLDALQESFALEALDANQLPSAQRAGLSTGLPTGLPTRLRDWLVVSHPLQATSRRYFERDRDPRLESRSERAHRGALARQQAIDSLERTPRRFLLPEGTGILSRPAKAIVDADGGATTAANAESAAVPTLTLDELIERVLRSTRYFAREVLALRLPRPEAVQGDLDPFELSPLEKASVGRELYADLAAGVPFSQAVDRMRANPALPVGFQGELLARGIRAEAQAIAKIAAARRAGDSLPDFPFELELPARAGASPARIVGRLDRLWREARIEAQYGRIGGNREAALWIHHLVLCALADGGYALPCESVGVGRPDRDDKQKNPVVVLSRVQEPLAILSSLFRWAWSVPDAPLPFFERASRTFADGLQKEGATEANAWREARSEFEGRDDSGWRQAEADQELEIVRIWEGRSPIERAAESGSRFGFDALAREFFEPLFGVRKRSAQ